MSEDRCTGHCCEDFSIEVSPEELAGSYQRWLGMSHYPETHTGDMEITASKGKGLLGRPSGINYDGGCAKIYADIHLIYPMLEFIKKDRSHQDNPGHAMPRTVYHYRCKHFNKEKKMCGIYDIRPQICRAYGLLGCGYKKCTWKKATDIRKADKEKIKKKEDILSGNPVRKGDIYDEEDLKASDGVVSTKEKCLTCKAPMMSEDEPPLGWRWVCVNRISKECSFRSNVNPYPMPF